jgi:hypothetical protein
MMHKDNRVSSRGGREMSASDTEELGTSTDYELLAKSVYENVLKQEGVENVEVRHNAKVVGKSGVAHQIDVLWRFRRAGVEHLVIIECKKYSSSVELSHVQSFRSVVEDINGAQGVMVTTVGFQSGARDFAAHHGIGMKLLRKPIDADWEGRIKTINIHLIIQAIDPRYPAQVKFKVPKEMGSRVEGTRIKGSPLEVQILDKEGNPKTPPMKTWIPQAGGTRLKNENGTVSGTIPLEDSYIRLEDSNGQEILSPVESVDITYRIQEIREEIVVDGGEVVKYILKDFESGEPEYLQR